MPAHHLAVLVLPEALSRDDFRASLAERRIQTSVHYPPIHTSPPIGALGRDVLCRHRGGRSSTRDAAALPAHVRRRMSRASRTQCLQLRDDGGRQAAPGDRTPEGAPARQSALLRSLRSSLRGRAGSRCVMRSLSTTDRYSTTVFTGRGRRVPEQAEEAGLSVVVVPHLAMGRRRLSMGGRARQFRELSCAPWRRRLRSSFTRTARRPAQSGRLAARQVGVPQSSTRSTASRSIDFQSPPCAPRLEIDRAKARPDHRLLPRRRHGDRGSRPCGSRSLHPTASALSQPRSTQLRPSRGNAPRTRAACLEFLTGRRSSERLLGSTRRRRRSTWCEPSPPWTPRRLHGLARRRRAERQDRAS